MPASRSRAPTTEARRRPYGIIIALAVVMTLALICSALPASLAARFLPKNIEAGDFTGTLWHGSVGRLAIGAHEAGAVEWQIHPLTLLRGRIACDVHWVKGAFLIDGALLLGGSSVEATDLHGGGPLGELNEMSPMPGWQADTHVEIERIVLKDNRFDAARGRVRFEQVSAPQLGIDSAGSYLLSFGADAVQSDGGALAHLEDQGGPLEVHANIDVQPARRLATLSGTVKERGEVPEALRRNINDLAQMRGRDPQGRVPLDFEFAL